MLNVFMLSRPPGRMRANRIRAMVCRVFLAVTLAALLPNNLSALAMGPGMFMVQNVPPGQEVNLRKLGGVLFTVYNRDGVEQDCVKAANWFRIAAEQGHANAQHALALIVSCSCTVSWLAIKAAHLPDNPEDLQLLAALRVGQFEAF